MQAAATIEGEGWVEEDAGRVGVWLFLLSEALLFGAFFAAYLSTRLGSPDCRLGTVVWPESGRLPGLALAAVNTLALLTSSFTMVRSIARARRGDVAGARSLLAATMGLGALFLVIKGFEYSLKIGHHLYPGSELALASPGLSIFLTYYYAMTILHGLHVLVGLVWNATVYANPAKMAQRAELAGLYWHFVDVVWVFLFPILYLI